MTVRGQEVKHRFDANPYITTGVSPDGAVAEGKAGDDTHRLADALMALGDARELSAIVDAALAGQDVGEYVAGGNACFIIVTNAGATVCFETAMDDEEYPFPLDGLQSAIGDWQRACAN